MKKEYIEQIIPEPNFNCPEGEQGEPGISPEKYWINYEDYRVEKDSYRRREQGDVIITRKTHPDIPGDWMWKSDYDAWKELCTKQRKKINVLYYTWTNNR